MNYNKAQDTLNLFYIKNDSTLLQQSLGMAEQAMTCEETKFKAIDLKVTILMLLTYYERGYKFIDSLDENDFKYSYRKKMYHDFFQAMEFETTGDTLRRNQLFNGVILDIKRYIQIKKSNGAKFNNDLYYDLIVAESKVLSKYSLSAEIELLKSQNPGQDIFFEGLLDTYGNETKVSTPIITN